MCSAWLNTCRGIRNLGSGGGFDSSVILNRRSFGYLKTHVQYSIFRFNLLELNFWIFFRKLGAIEWYRKNYLARR